MKPSLLFALLCTLTCSSCQSFQWPWNKTPANADPYAAAATGQYQQYPGNATYPPAGANQNYAYPNYSTAGEQAQVTPANGAPPQNYNPPQEDWSNGGAAQSAAPSKKTAAPKGATKGGSYTVKRGDTLSSISRNNGTTVSKLMQLNGLKSTTIRDGQSLRVR